MDAYVENPSEKWTHKHSFLCIGEGEFSVMFAAFF